MSEFLPHLIDFCLARTAVLMIGIEREAGDDLK
jgi:hypothetical protein